MFHSKDLKKWYFLLSHACLYEYCMCECVYICIYIYECCVYIIFILV